MPDIALAREIPTPHVAHKAVELREWEGLNQGHTAVSFLALISFFIHNTVLSAKL